MLRESKLNARHDPGVLRQSWGQPSASIRIVLAPDAEQKAARFAAVRSELRADLGKLDVPHVEPPADRQLRDDRDCEKRTEINRRRGERAHIAKPNNCCALWCRILSVTDFGSPSRSM